MLWSESGYFDTPAETKNPLHFWSLGIEKQFYIFWPLCLLLFRRSRTGMLCLMLLGASTSFALNFHIIGTDSSMAFYFP